MLLGDCLEIFYHMKIEKYRAKKDKNRNSLKTKYELYHCLPIKSLPFQEPFFITLSTLFRISILFQYISLQAAKIPISSTYLFCFEMTPE